MSVKELLGGAMWKGLLLAMLLWLLLLAAAALMLQRGLLPESAAPAMVCSACAAAVFCGGRTTVRGGKGAPLMHALSVAAGLYLAMWLIALSGETPQFSAHGPVLTAAVLGGGFAAGLSGGRKGKRQPGKRQAGKMAGRGSVKKRR